MGERELQEALRGKAQARIREIWQAAEEAVAARRAEIRAEQAVLRERAEQESAATAVVIRRNVLAAAALEAQQQCLVTEQRLCERLHALAVRRLPTLIDGARSRVWQALAAELPAAKWQRIRVHPADLPAARQRFPTAEVLADATLGGGVVAEAGDGRIVIDNSLAGRLERAWPELLVPLFAAINEEVERDAAGVATAD